MPARVPPRSGGNLSASRFPVGAPSTAQHNRSATTVSASAFGASVLSVGFTTPGPSAAASALRTWLRCHPVVPQLVENHALGRLVRSLATRPDRLGHSVPLAPYRSMIGAYPVIPAESGRHALGAF